MHKGFVFYLILLAIVVVVVYYETGGFNMSALEFTTTVLSTSNTTSIAPTIPTTINYTHYINPCSNFSLLTTQTNTSIIGRCHWNGGDLGLWVAAGDTGYEGVTITGADNKTYVKQGSAISCTTFYLNFTAPAQNYTVTLHTGVGGGSCGTTLMKLNTTTTPPNMVYKYVYNGDFSSGQYNGWKVVGTGFDTTPLNISKSNVTNCYNGQPWSGYNGSFFATTYNCGLSNSLGNLTSSPFYVSVQKPFLNFKIISHANEDIYVEILQNSTPRIIAHYDTFNTSLNVESASTFLNASIPLTLLINKEVRIKVVAATINPQTYIAIGDFALSNKPLQQKGILVNMLFNTS